MHAHKYFIDLRRHRHTALIEVLLCSFFAATCARRYIWLYPQHIINIFATLSRALPFVYTCVYMYVQIKFRLKVLLSWYTYVWWPCYFVFYGCFYDKGIKEFSEYAEILLFRLLKRTITSSLSIYKWNFKMIPCTKGKKGFQRSRNRLYLAANKW